MLDLSPVTLVFVETRAHEITRRVIDDCISKAKFGEILIYTNKVEPFAGLDARFVSVPDFPNKDLAGRFYYGEAIMGVETDFALMLEWDAGIHDPKMWQPGFYDYDYIGAPWPPHIHRRGSDVGNGGFMLLSRKLGRFINAHQSTHPVNMDMSVAHRHRAFYEQNGFSWPSAREASFFSWELGVRNPQHFGYHGAFTWPEVLPREEVTLRVSLMINNPYLIYKLPGLVRAAPWVLTELSAEDAAKLREAIPPGHLMGRLIGGARVPGGISPQQRAAAMLAQAQRQRQGLLIRARQQTGQKA